MLDNACVSWMKRSSSRPYVRSLKSKSYWFLIFLGIICGGWCTYSVVAEPYGLWALRWGVAEAGEVFVTGEPPRAVPPYDAGEAFNFWQRLCEKELTIEETLAVSWMLLENHGTDHSERAPFARLGVSLCQRAIDRAQEDIRLRRMQALLILVISGYSPSSFSEQMSALSEGSSVDPDNAIYEYAMAMLCWQKSALEDHRSIRNVYPISHKEEPTDLSEGDRHFAAGVRKTQFRLPVFETDSSWTVATTLGVHPFKLIPSSNGFHIGFLTERFRYAAIVRFKRLVKFSSFEECAKQIDLYEAVLGQLDLDNNMHLQTYKDSTWEVRLMKSDLSHYLEWHLNRINRPVIPLDALLRRVQKESVDMRRDESIRLLEKAELFAKAEFSGRPAISISGDDSFSYLPLPKYNLLSVAYHLAYDYLAFTIILIGVGLGQLNCCRTTSVGPSVFWRMVYAFILTFVAYSRIEFWGLAYKFQIAIFVIAFTIVVLRWRRRGIFATPDSVAWIVLLVTVFCSITFPPEQGSGSWFRSLVLGIREAQDNLQGESVWLRFLQHFSEWVDCGGVSRLLLFVVVAELFYSVFARHNTAALDRGPRRCILPSHFSKPMIVVGLLIWIPMSLYTAASVRTCCLEYELELAQVDHVAWSARLQKHLSPGDSQNASVE